MAYYNLGVALQKLREHQKAKECYKKAIQINPNYAIAYYNLGNVLKKLGEHQKAIVVMKKQSKLILIMQLHIIILE